MRVVPRVVIEWDRFAIIVGAEFSAADRMVAVHFSVADLSSEDKRIVAKDSKVVAPVGDGIPPPEWDLARIGGIEFPCFIVDLLEATADRVFKTAKAAVFATIETQIPGALKAAETLESVVENAVGDMFCIACDGDEATAAATYGYLWVKAKHSDPPIRRQAIDGIRRLLAGESPEDILKAVTP
ncbi:MAG: hypothetical protein KatS3mg082_1426 [Nitrospiraceae bacterium]|nr:MAG: hypothetical protein KatS3mg082_1426 [Nitrospiraceae bacterium]